jgi:catechol 2,3-dioxygenase-like lactoylglutathione lyase family enzyme
MRGAVLFVAGVLVGLAAHVAMAQNAGAGVVMMNHVAVVVPDLTEALAHYTQKMGYREAFRALDASGQPRLIYLHISRNTFLELQPATPQRPAGVNHYGLHVEDVAATVARLRQAGLTVSDVNTSDTGALLANVTDPYMGRIELAQLPPESMHQKAIASWR